MRDWFDDAAAALIPDYDGTLATARSAAGTCAGRAKAGNTRRAWCDWCDRFGLPCLLPGRAADVAAFLAAGRGRGLSITTLTLRRATIRCQQPLFRRIWTPPRSRIGRNTPLPCVGYAAIDAGTVARVVQARAKAAGFDPGGGGGHSLKHGALSTGMERGIHPSRRPVRGAPAERHALSRLSAVATSALVTDRGRPHRQVDVEEIAKGTTG